MDDTTDSTPKSRPITKPQSRNNSFFLLGCFGFFKKNAKKKKQKVISADRKKDRWQFTWSALRRKKLQLSVKVNFCKKVHAEDEIGRKKQFPVLGEIRAPKEARDTNLQAKTLKRRHKPAQLIKQLEQSKSSDHKNISITERSQLHSYLEKKEETKKDEIALLESLEECLKPSQNTARQLTQQRKNKKVTIEEQKDRVHEKNQNPLQAKKFIAMSEYIYGLSILAVTLTMMLVWGKLCTIVCTSAWFYLVQWLKRAREYGVSVDSGGNGSNRIHSNIVNEAYKKKVVLDGFLERKKKPSEGAVRIV